LDASHSSRSDFRNRQSFVVYHARWIDNLQVRVVILKKATQSMCDASVLSEFFGKCPDGHGVIFGMSETPQEPDAAT